MLCHFCLFLSCVLGVFNSPVATPAHGLLGLSSSRRLRFASEKASLLALYIYLCHHPLSHFTKLLIGLSSSGLVTVHILSFHVWPFAFKLQVTRIKQYRS